MYETSKVESVAVDESFILKAGAPHAALTLKVQDSPFVIPVTERSYFSPTAFRETSYLVPHLD
jgi:hypothetical protein